MKLVKEIPKFEKVVPVCMGHWKAQVTMLGYGSREINFTRKLPMKNWARGDVSGLVFDMFDYNG
ncbi:MAG: hypothetical protein IPO37_10305 [Saprospiraceae bacterium]|nr:hypothetical protein [Saprospiraceae bacterium]